MLQILPMLLSQEKTGNISKNLLNEIKQINYSLYQKWKYTKMKSVKKMSTIFMNSENRKTSGKIGIQGRDNYLPF